jgi:hypothetical protein
MPSLKRDLPDYKFSAAAGTSQHTVSLRAGMRCRQITDGATRGSFWIDEFPADLFPFGSMIRHDAEHYGITVDAEYVSLRAAR